MLMNLVTSKYMLIDSNYIQCQLVTDACLVFSMTLYHVVYFDMFTMSLE